MVYTPARDKEGNLSNKLVHDLTFEVGRKDSMLLTGHNGAGKSSVFRCLAVSTRPSNNRPAGCLISFDTHFARIHTRTHARSCGTTIHCININKYPGMCCLRDCLWFHKGLWKIPEGQIQKPGE